MPFKPEIPEEIKNIAREFAEVAKKNSINEFKGTFRVFGMGWDNEVHISWNAGRHNEDSNDLKITSEFRELIYVKENQ